MELIKKQQADAQLMRPSSKLLKSLCNVAQPGKQLSDFNTSTIEAIAQGYHQQIRHLPEEAQVQVVSAAIRQFAESYGSRKSIPTEVLTECVELILDNFGKIGAMEIRTAYQLWSLRIINGAEMWGGEFNALQLGRVLSDYVRYRQKVVNEVINFRTEEAKRRKMEAYEEQMNQKTIDGFPEELENARQAYRDGTGFQKWENVIGNWYGLAVQHNIIDLSDEEKLPYWKRGQKLARIEIDSEIRQLKESRRIPQAKAHEKEYETGSEAFNRRAAVIAQKIIVHEKLIQQ